jgi:hypothetical protein
VVEVGSSSNYNATVDIRATPLPPDQVIEIDEGKATGEEVLVSCTIAAKLAPVGDALSVEQAFADTTSEWRVQEFTPAGNVEWAWTSESKQAR